MRAIAHDKTTSLWDESEHLSQTWNLEERSKKSIENPALKVRMWLLRMHAYERAILNNRAKPLGDITDVIKKVEEQQQNELHMHLIEFCKKFDDHLDIQLPLRSEVAGLSLEVPPRLNKLISIISNGYLEPRPPGDLSGLPQDPVAATLQMKTEEDINHVFPRNYFPDHEDPRRKFFSTKDSSGNLFDFSRNESGLLEDPELASWCR